MAADKPMARMPRREITTGPESFSSSASSVRTGRIRPPAGEDAWAAGRSMTGHRFSKRLRRLAPAPEMASGACGPSARTAYTGDLEQDPLDAADEADLPNRRS